MADLGVAVEQGWVHADIIMYTLGPMYRLLTYEDGAVRFEHRCDRGRRGVLVCAPLLCIGPHAGGPGGTHVLTRNENEQPTIEGSIWCHDCGTHGFVTDGRWRNA